jgi:hypothetical protein
MLFPGLVCRAAESRLDIGIIAESVADCFDVDTDTDQDGSWV